MAELTAENDVEQRENIYLDICNYMSYNQISYVDNDLLVFRDQDKEYTLNDVESYFFIPKYGTIINTTIFRKELNNVNISNFYIGIKAINKDHACRFLMYQLGKAYLNDFYISKNRPEKLLPLVLVKESYIYGLYDNYCEDLPELFEF